MERVFTSENGGFKTLSLTSLRTLSLYSPRKICDVFGAPTSQARKGRKVPDVGLHRTHFQFYVHFQLYIADRKVGGFFAVFAVEAVEETVDIGVFLF